MFLAEWREFPSAPSLAEKNKTSWQLASRCCWNRARSCYASEFVSFLVWLRTYRHRKVRKVKVSYWLQRFRSMQLINATLCTNSYQHVCNTYKYQKLIKGLKYIKFWTFCQTFLQNIKNAEFHSVSICTFCMTFEIQAWTDLHTGQLYPHPHTPGNILDSHLCLRPRAPQGHNAARRFRSTENRNETIGNRTDELPVCSAVPQPTAPLRAPN